jgi:hypothetical protein
MWWQPFGGVAAKRCIIVRREDGGFSRDEVDGAGAK